MPANACSGKRPSRAYMCVIELAADGSFSAYIPDLPGCVTCAESLNEVRRLIEEAVNLHVDSLRNHAELVPPAAASVHIVHVT